MSNIKKYLDKLSPSIEDRKLAEEDDVLTASEIFFLSHHDAPELQDRISEVMDGDPDSAELARKKIENERLTHQLKELKKDSNKKDDFYKTVKRLTISWLIFIAVLVLANSINIPWNDGIYEFSISSQVLIALVSSTTASVIGLFFIVGRYLFPNNQP